MLLKDFPPGLSLGYSVHVIFLMLQSTLMRAEEMITQADVPLTDEDRGALIALIDLLDCARVDTARLQKRMMN